VARRRISAAERSDMAGKISADMIMSEIDRVRFFGGSQINEQAADIGLYSPKEIEQMKTAEEMWDSLDPRVNIVEHVSRGKAQFDPGRFCELLQEFPGMQGVISTQSLYSYFSSDTIGLEIDFADDSYADIKRRDNGESVMTLCDARGKVLVDKEPVNTFIDLVHSLHDHGMHVIEAMHIGQEDRGMEDDSHAYDYDPDSLEDDLWDDFSDDGYDEYDVVDSPEMRVEEMFEYLLPDTDLSYYDGSSGVCHYFDERMFVEALQDAYGIDSVRAAKASDSARDTEGRCSLTLTFSDGRSMDVQMFTGDVYTMQMRSADGALSEKEENHWPLDPFIEKLHEIQAEIEMSGRDELVDPSSTDDPEL